MDESSSDSHQSPLLNPQVQQPKLNHQDNQPNETAKRPKIIQFNLIFAAISYSLSFVLILFILFFSTQGSFAQVITSSISLVGAFIFTLAIITTLIYYFISKKHGKLIDVNRLTILQILLIWSPLLLSLVFYGLNNHQYSNTNRPNQSTVLSLIDACKVTNVQDIGNGDIEVTETDQDPSKGAIITHGNINTLNSELKTVNNNCTFVKRAYDSNTAITKWLTQDEVASMIKQCKVKSIQGFTQENIQNVLSNVTVPSGASTGFLLEDWGHDELLYINQISLAKIDPVAQQFQKTCNNTNLINYGL